MLISESIERFNDYLIGLKRPDTTIDSYAAHLKDFLSAAGDKSLDEITIQEILSFTKQMAGLSSSSVAAKLSAVASWVRFLKMVYKFTGISSDDFKFLRPKVSQNIPEHLELWQITALIEHCKDIEDEVLIRLLYGAGLRASELLSLTRDDVMENAEGTVRLRVKGKGDKERRVPLNENTRDCLKRYLGYLAMKYRNMDNLFPYKYGALWYRVKKISARAKIEVHPHMLRHSYATGLLEEGTNMRVIADMMGHGSMNTTMRYAKVSDKMAEDAANRLKG